jgi:hypothetical protein
MVFGSSGSGFGNPPVGNQGIITRPVFKSDNYVSGVSGWAIFRNGNVEFNSGTFRGTVTGGAFEGTDFIIDPQGIFFYSGTPALGNLVFAVSPTSGTDQFGNAYIALLQIGLNGESQITFSVDGSGNGFLKFNLPGFFNGGIEMFTSGSFAGFDIFGPANEATNENDYVNIAFNSSDGASSANLQIDWYDPTNTDHVFATCDYSGFNVVAGVAGARKPGTGTSKTNPAQIEAWNPITVDSGWTIVRQPYYRIANDWSHVLVTGSLTHAAFSAAVNVCGSNPIPALYRPLNGPQNIAGSAIPNRASSEITTAGVIVAEPGGISCSECDMNGYYPLGV